MLDSNVICFDNNATTPINKKVVDAIPLFLTENFANHSNIHHFGFTVTEAVENVSVQVADLMGVEENEIIFISGSTEAINLALKGVAENLSAKGKHIIAVSTDHDAVLDTCKHIENKICEVDCLLVGKEGLIDLIELKNSVRADTSSAYTAAFVESSHVLTAIGLSDNALASNPLFIGEIHCKRGK